MKRPIFTGSGVAIVTPFAKDGVDLAAFARLLDFQLENGTDAVIVCGTTGESSTMTYEERMQTVEFCIRHVDGRVPVIAGTGSNNTRSAIALSRDAKNAGADGLLVVTPYYNKATQEGLVRHYTAIADAVDLPMILYDVPSRTGVAFQAETYAALARHPNIVGVKEASGNLGLIQKTRSLCPDDFYIWSGNDDETAPICLLGGVGVISVVANVMPRAMHDLVNLCLSDRFREAGQLQLKLKPLSDALFCEVNPIPVKTALNLMGFRAGELRLPLCDMGEGNRERLKSVLKSYALI